MDNITKITNILNKFFNKKNGIIEIAKKTNFIKRLRKITPVNFLRSAITTLISEETVSLRDYAISFQNNSSINISKNAIKKRLATKSCTDFLEKTLKYLCEITFYNQFKFASLPGIRSVNVVDSSEIKLKEILKYEFPGMRQFKALMKIQMTIDFLQGNFKKLELTPGKYPDQGYKGYIECTDSDTLVLSDLGYFSCEFMQAIVNKNAYFLNRYKKK